jgi:hypothetical protein
MFKTKFTVEQIHNEIDTAQDRLICQAEKLLAELQIPTETHIEKKADQLLSLGFKNSETVKSAESLKEKRKAVQSQVISTKEQADLLQYYKQTYPFQKFLTEAELERICTKYRLIHAPVRNYIKDVPEKNVVEMKNTAPMKSKDIHAGQFFITVTSFGHWDIPSRIKNKLKEPVECFYAISENSITDSYLKQLIGETEFGGYVFNKARVDRISKSGLFIAAPESHFDLKGLSKKSKFGFFNVTVTEVKDPIVFEYCRGGFIRVITKWGTDDDQSYLDPSLTNEKLN